MFKKLALKHIDLKIPDVRNKWLGGKRGHADCGSTADSGLRTALWTRGLENGHANKKIPYVSAFSTLVENADT